MGGQSKSDPSKTVYPWYSEGGQPDYDGIDHCRTSDFGFDVDADPLRIYDVWLSRTCDNSLYHCSRGGSDDRFPGLVSGRIRNLHSDHEARKVLSEHNAVR